MSGKIIVVEGIDAAGKGTFIQKLLEQVKPDLRIAVSKSLPKSNLRTALVTGEITDPKHITLLYRVALDKHIQEVKSLVTTHDIVICDRSIMSWYAYQGYGFQQKAKISVLEGINVFEPSYEPDYVVYLDIEYATMRRRLKDNRDGMDYIESRGENFFLRVKEGFYCLIKYGGFVELWKNTHHIAIDAEQSPDEVYQQFLSGGQDVARSFSYCDGTPPVAACFRSLV